MRRAASRWRGTIAAGAAIGAGLLPTAVTAAGPSSAARPAAVENAAPGTVALSITGPAAIASEPNVQPPRFDYTITLTYQGAPITADAVQTRWTFRAPQQTQNPGVELVQGNMFDCELTPSFVPAPTVSCTTDFVEGRRVTTVLVGVRATREPGVGTATVETATGASATWTTTFTQTDAPAPPPPPLPPPEVGRTANVEVVSGTVLVRLPGSDRFVELEEGEQIPVGSLVDTRKGAVRLTSATGSASARSPAARTGSATQSAVFRDGLMQVLQARARNAHTILALRGGDFRACRPARRAPTAAAAKRKKPVRQLWGQGKGRFRTRGKYSSATVRGTAWLVADRCDGTLTYVRAGRVEVDDHVLRRTIQLRKGQSYLARPRR